jgi:hypothetical protein
MCFHSDGTSVAGQPAAIHGLSPLTVADTSYRHPPRHSACATGVTAMCGKERTRQDYVYTYIPLMAATLIPRSR